MTFRAKPVVKRAHTPVVGEPGPAEPLPQPRLRPRRRRRRRSSCSSPPALSWYNDHLAPVGSVDGQIITKDEFKDRYRDRDAGASTRPSAGSATAAVAGHLTEAQAQTQQQSIEPAAPAARRRSRSSGSSTPSSRPSSPAEEGVTVTAGRHRRPARRPRRRRPSRATPGSSRSQPDDRRRRHRADRPPRWPRPRPRPTRRSRTSRPARPGTTSPRPSRPTPRPRRRPATSAGSRPTTRQADEAYLDGGLRGRGQHADRRHRGRRRDLPDRPGHRDRARDGRRGLPGQAPERRHRPRQVPRGRRRRRHPPEARGQDRRRRDQARRRSGSVAEIYIAGDRRRPAGRRGQGPPHPVLAQGRPAAARRDLPGRPIRPGRRPRPRPTRPTTSSRRTRACSTRSPGPRATSRARRAPTGTGGKLPYFDNDSQVDEAFKAAIIAPGPQAGQTCSRRSSPPSAGTSSRSCTGPTDADQLNALKTQADGGADFGALARDNSEAPDASTRRRPRLGRQGPARRALDRRDLRARRSARPRDVVTDRRTTGIYLFRSSPRRRGRPRAASSRPDQVDGLLELVRRQEGRRDDHPRRVHHGRATS